MAKILELLSKSYKEIKVLPAGAVSAGDYATYNEAHGFHLVDFSAEQVAAGEEATLITKADQVKCDKTTGETWIAGEAAYWVTGTSKVSNVLTANTLIGYIKEAALSADVSGFIEFDGLLDFAKL